MAENEKTPLQIANESLAELEATSEGQLEGLVDKVKSSFWDQIKEFLILLHGFTWQGFTKKFVEGTGLIGIKFIEKGQPLVDEDTTSALQEILDSETDPVVILKRMETLTRFIPMLGWAYSVVQYLLTLGGILMSNMSATKELSAQSVLMKMQPMVPPLEILIEALFKDPDTVKDVSECLKRMGLSDSRVKLILQGVKSLLPLGETKLAFLREDISEDTHDKILRAYKFGDDDIELIKGLYKEIPGPSDLITMAVREVFTPEIVERFGQMEGFPPEFARWGKQVGLSEFWAQNYWAAHWILPSIGQGFEMLHRDVIGEDDLSLLLKALDIMPFWRDRLKEISYRPLTRVDVRRMYGHDVLNEDEVYTSYKNIGYNDLDATRMTEFTVAYKQEKERELTKTDILVLYKKHVLERSDVVSMLTKIGFSEDSSELIATRADFEIFTSYKKERISYIRKAFVAGKIDEAIVLQRLGALDLPSKETNFLLESWNLERANKVKSLSIENLKAFYQNNVITDRELRVELLEIGYNETDTSRFITLFQKGS